MTREKRNTDLPPSAQRVVDVAIVGSGLSGLGMAIRLKQSGVDSFVVIEREGEVGGTWNVNRYPGCGCDVQSHLYSFSFAQNPNWSRMFARQPEILDYLKDCADRFGVRPHVRFNSDLTDAQWNEATGRWIVSLAGGDQIHARVLISAVGGLSRPSIPKLPGIAKFKGAQFHSQQWDQEFDLQGKRVAVVGTGASAIQFVPQIASKVEQLDVYQRSAPWVLPKPDRDITESEKALYRKSWRARIAQRLRLYWQLEARALAFIVNPRLLKLGEREAKRHLRRQVPDRELRAKLKPDYALGCKRALISNDYYPALMRDNVALHTGGIKRVTATGVVDKDGVKRPVDAIIYGTGFDVRNPLGPIEIRGREGRSIHEAWSDSPSAYLGMSISGFPNLFLMLGPNTGLGHNSIVYMIESQIEYILGAIRKIRRSDLHALDVKQDQMLNFSDEMQARSQQTVWTQGGCKSWYLDDQGNNFSLWPGFTWQYRQRTNKFKLKDYHITRTPLVELVQG